MTTIDIGTFSNNDLIHNYKIFKKDKRLETLRLYNFHLVRTDKISFEKYKKGVISLKKLIDNNWNKIILVPTLYIEKDEENSMNFLVQQFEQETTEAKTKKRKYEELK